jgi:PAS domain S-box-containing protein
VPLLIFSGRCSAEAIDEAPVLIFVADDEGHYVAVNRHACEVLRYSRRHLLGMTVPEVAVAPEAPELYASMLSQGHLKGHDARPV